MTARAPRPSYREALGYLYALEPRGIRLGLSRVERALAALGNPHRRFGSVHVGGTNGKGSVSAMVEAALRAGGVRTGLYTSPHLHRFTERIRVDGREIPRGEVARRVERILRLPIRLTFFETATLVAFGYFADAGVEVAVVEVGLGGRLDATNVLSPLVSVITNVERDHEDLLGKGIRAIAREKVGIVKRGVEVVSAARRPEARRQIVRAAGNEAKLIDRDFRLRPGRGGLEIDVRAGAERLGGLRLALEGPHQRENAAVAVVALFALRRRGVAVSDGAIRRGLATVRWPGRLERLRRRRVSWILDAAHNEAGAVALGRALGPRRYHLVFGASANKRWRAMLRILAPRAASVVFTRAQARRGADPAELAAAFGGTVVPEVRSAVEEARRRVRARPAPVVVTGSIFVVAEARAALWGRSVRTERAVAL